MDDAELIIRTAHEMADAARAAILPWFRHADLSADTKIAGGFDPVTQADREAERAMRAVLARLRPGDAILGEEFGVTPGTTGLTWILDPIDGTRAFLCGAASWGVLIGLSDGQRMIYGLIDQPYLAERFEGGLGLARLTMRDGTRPLRTRAARPGSADGGLAGSLEGAILMTTFPELGSPEEARAFRRVADRVRLTRYGLDCYAYALLALGQVDLVIEAGLQSYDIAGPLAVVQAAGGIVTDWQGGSAAQGGQVIAAASEALHRAALDLLNG